MEDKIINNKNSLCNNSSHSRSPVKSYSPDFSKATFEEVLEWVKDNSSFECFEETQRTAAEEICLIMAEVLKLPSGLNVRIGGNDLPAELVGSVYKRIQKEHIELVLDNFSRAAYTIKHKKTYLRTALYNSVFEYEAHFSNWYASKYPQSVNEPFGKAVGK